MVNDFINIEYGRFSPSKTVFYKVIDLSGCFAHGVFNFEQASLFIE